MQASVAGLPALAAQFDVGADGLEGLLTLEKYNEIIGETEKSKSKEQEK